MKGKRKGEKHGVCEERTTQETGAEVHKGDLSYAADEKIESGK